MLLLAFIAAILLVLLFAFTPWWVVVIFYALCCALVIGMLTDAPEIADHGAGAPLILHPTSDAALIRAEPEHGHHHRDCSVHFTRWCDCKGLPRDVTDAGHDFICTRTDLGRAA